MIIDWLFEECEDPIELTQFEYDLLETYNCYEGVAFRDFEPLIKMKQKEHFEEIDENMKIKDILINCEVVE